jgi:hypothetical protein
MPIYRSKYDPYDVDRRQPFHSVEEGGVRARIWRNETYRGIIWKFDVVQVSPRKNTDEISRGIPLDEAVNAAVCMQKLVDWVYSGRRPRPAKK